MSTGTATTKQPAVTFERLPQETYPAWGFRPGVPMFPIKMNFIFLNGGMGDYICWLPAIQWLMAEATWIEGNVIIPTYFREVADYFMRKYAPKWTHMEYKALGDIPKVNDMAFRGPVELNRESLNATGAHLLTCGWVYFTNKEKAPPGWENYPHFEQADLNAVPLCERAKLLKAGKYVVLTTGITTNSRTVPPGAWNHVIEHVIDKGLLPVFLGKSVMETGNPRNIHTRFDENLRIDLGLDLRDQTSLMQAASIMSRAACVVGHDNGLLHLAGCTDAPIVFGYNLASPEHRQPARRVGKIYNVVLSDSELACNMCQSKTNFVIGYNFRDCFYGDTVCMKMLFDNGAARWKKQIDLALKENAL